MQKPIKLLLESVNIKKIYNEQFLSNIATAIKYNSKQVSKGDIFVCLQGIHTNGNLYIEESITNGAVAIITQQEPTQPQKFSNIPIIVVDDSNLALAKVSANFYEHPSKKVLLIGVTGTNGKTTITYLLESIFSSAGFKTGVIGTINYRFEDKIIEANNTTPFAPELQKILYDMVNSKVEVVIMEVSSHSLAQKRVAECEFDVAIFTNLSHEHLDYHNNIQEYFYAKSLLFRNMSKEKKEIFKLRDIGKKVSIINYDDAYGKKLIELCNCEEIILCSKGIKNKNGNKKIVATNIEYSRDKTQFEIYYNGTKKVKVFSKLIGEFNVYNILLAFAAAYSQNINVDYIIEGISKVEHIPGRLEVINTPKNSTVIIDYAHTPDALQKVITSIKKIEHKNLIVVFGCGGDRDRSKRPVMGAITTTLADYVIVTSDNPRTEDPQRILLDIEVGIKKVGKTNYEIIPDRKEAIFRALSIAKPNDIVLLAGKGHENYQIIGTQKIPFDEREVIKEYFKNI